MGKSLWNFLFLSTQAAVPALVMYAASSRGIPFSHFTRDPNALAQAPWYAGGLSLLTTTLWAVGAAVCLTTASLANKLDLDRRTKDFFQSFGVFAAFLWFDDLFQMHEDLYPRIFHVTETRIFAFYAVVLVLLIWRHRDVIRRTDTTLLWASLATFGVAMFADILSDQMAGYIKTDLHYFFEDGLKYTAVAVWVGYFVQAAKTPLLR